MDSLRNFLIVAICIAGTEAKSYYEAISPSGTSSVQPFNVGQSAQNFQNPGQVSQSFDGQHGFPADKDYYVGFLDMEVDSNMVIAGTAFLLTLLLLTINLFYPLSQIHLPLIDGNSTRDSRGIEILQDMEDISSKLPESSKVGLM